MRRSGTCPDPYGAEHRLLEPCGARVILGSEAVVREIVPTRSSMFGPRGAVLAAPGGPLFVCDTGHHRLLIWDAAPAADGAAADSLIGQPDFYYEGRNAKCDIGPATLNVPTGVAAADGILAVADAWNHRVLLWFGYPTTSNRPADVVVGQRDLHSGIPNRGADRPSANSLNWCYGVALAEGRLVVADTGNRRVLVWNQIPDANGTPADLVLGQSDFVTRDENAGQEAGAVGMRWPHGVSVAGNALFVSDAGNHRVMVWSNWPSVNGTPCQFALGQPDLASNSPNRGHATATADGMNMPYGISLQGDRVIVADTANSRILGLDATVLASGKTATALAGQHRFVDNGDNRWSPPVRDSLCWPYGISACDSTTVIADSGNNRVMLWDFARPVS